MALWTHYAVGTYTQISVNWHAYIETFEPLVTLAKVMDQAGFIDNPYANESVVPTTMGGNIERVDKVIHALLDDADSGHMGSSGILGPDESYGFVWWLMLRAHEYYREGNYDEGIRLLYQIQATDWATAGIEWLERRKAAHEKRASESSGSLRRS